MEYKINSQFFEDVLELKHEKEVKNLYADRMKLRQYIKENINTPKASIKFYFSGYLQAIEDAAGIVNVNLDMTYATLDNLKPAIYALTDLQDKNGYEKKRNAVVTMKTLSAYLTMMAINNHKVKLSVDLINKSGSERPDLWGDFYRLKLNEKRDSDFLQYAIKGISTSPIEVDNGFYFEAIPLIGAYKRITRKDLQEYGLGNMIVSFGPPSEDVKEFLKGLR